jgi:hypothetical protein
MMICFNCTPDAKDRLDELIKLGSYRDYGEALAAAVRTQVLFEKEVTAKGSIVIGGTTPAVQTVPKTETKTITRTADPKAIAAIPTIFSTFDFPEQQPAGLAEVPGDESPPTHPLPLDRWMFGQQNRLLPAKVNARALIRLFAETGRGLPLAKTAARIAIDAAVLGAYLVALDTRRKSQRDDTWATAFPTTGESSEKGRSRYANQFVAYRNSRDELSGLMIDLKLIAVEGDGKNSVIVPTKAAWELAVLPSPVLDPTGDDAAARFSAEEQAMLLTHIASAVPIEALAYRAILETIGAGNTSPERIDAALKEIVSSDRASELSQSFLASQRSGAVSRMSDLGLVERQREGIRVSYFATKEGVAYGDRLARQ